MDSLKETDKPAPNPSKHLRIEVDEELMRQMIAGQAPLDSKVVRRIPEPEEGADTKRSRGRHIVPNGIRSIGTDCCFRQVVAYRCELRGKMHSGFPS